MSIEADFRTLLLTGGGSPAPVAALVGERVVWNELPQAIPKPCLCLWNVTGLPDHHMRGPSGLVYFQVQADCWHESDRVTECIALRDAVIAVAGGFKGIVGATEFQGVFVRHIAGFNDPQAGAPARRYSRFRLDLDIWHAPA